MISVLATGISKYNFQEPIKCAADDAKKVYNAFEYTLKNHFSHNNSFCLYDITDDDFVKLLKLSQNAYSAEDVLFLYFSGHGEVLDETLYLCFSNDGETKSKQGKTSIESVFEIIKDFKAKIVLVLDCCHSGAALKLTISKVLNQKSNVSVIASSESYQPSKYDTEGSKFTNTFCNALINLYEEAREITLVNLIKNMERLGGNEALINVQEGECDVVLSVGHFANASKRFSRDFLDRALDSRLQLREMLWYQAKGIPSTLKFEILNEYLDSEISEPSWLVRRAMGTFIYSINETNTKHEIIKRFLQSSDWMRNCVGLIGGRNSLSNEEIKELFIGYLRNKDISIDSIWLANLYLLDNNFDDLDTILSSKLIHTSWGILEIFRRYSIFSDDDKLVELVTKLNQLIKDKELLSPLHNYIWLDGKYYNLLKRNISKEILLNELKESELDNQLFHSEKRGNIEDVGIKWLYSFLYGSWRDQLILNLRDFLECSPESKIMQEFRMIKKNPTVEFRMYIFQYISQNIEVFDNYENVLEGIEWGLSDPHPWVRRVSLNLFRNNPIIETAFENTIDSNLYPGLFDLILEGKSVNIDVSSYIERYQFNTREKKSLNFYLDIL